MKEVIQQANQIVNDTEKKWLQDKWDEYQAYKECGSSGEHILEEIKNEMDRLNYAWTDWYDE